MSHLNGTDLDDPLDVDAINARLAELRQYRTANVPPAQLDTPTVTGHGVSVGQPPARWTTTPPIVPGWYWVWNGYEVWACQFIERNGVIVYAISTDDYEPVYHTGSHWQRITSMPAPPEVTQPSQNDNATVELVAAAVERGDMLIITPDCTPKRVLVELQRMFGGDPIWWEGFVREAAK